MWVARALRRSDGKRKLIRRGGTVNSEKLHWNHFGSGWRKSCYWVAVTHSLAFPVLWLSCGVQY
jgi:hypothetical protein